MNLFQFKRLAEGATKIDRFMNQVAPDPNSGCWIWTGHETGKGYGSFFLSHKKRIRAHRFSYEYFNGSIPNGLTVDHLCRVRMCVNPRHLEAVSIRENVLRGIGLSAQNARKTHCCRGHELSHENIRYYGRERVCVPCETIRNARRRKNYVPALAELDRLMGETL